jgi:ubiquinone/menaquinone biosynthesis C-methylase UbiE
LQWIGDRRQQVIDLYADVVDHDLLANRIDTIEQYVDNPLGFMTAANIRYIAPGDASNTGLSSESIDYHISNTVLEHIDRENIQKIMAEAKRVMKSDGLAIHFIDLSDHFQHQDSQINKINFLKYTEKEWLKIAGNNFAYCNRLRSSAYLELFDGFEILKINREVDSESLQQLSSGIFAVDAEFKNMDGEDLACTALSVCLTKSGN